MNEETIAYALDLIAMYESAGKDPARPDSAFNTIPESSIDTLVRAERGATRFERLASYLTKHGMSPVRRMA